MKPFDETMQRERFENFLLNNLLFMSEDWSFDTSRNCYVDYNVHLAWQCWRGALQ